MTPTEATNRITECVRQRMGVHHWIMHGGFITGLVAETIADVVATVISEVVDERLKFLEHTADKAPANPKVDIHNELT